MVFPSMAQTSFDKAASGPEPLLPTLPPVLTPADLSDGTPRRLDGCEVRGQIAIDRPFPEEEVEGTRFTDCRLLQCDFSGSMFKDVVFEGCDLSNALLDRAGFKRCILKDCKLTGASFQEALFEDVVARNCVFSYGTFFRSRLRAAAFKECDFTETDMAEMTLHRASVDQCRFCATNFFRTRLVGLDFTTSHLEGVVFSDGGDEVFGTKMTLYQAASLARRLGVIVEE